MEDDFVKKLKEKHENGEISKETYEDILRRYQEKVKEEKEVMVEEDNAESPRSSEDNFYDIGELVTRSVSQALKNVEKELNEDFPTKGKKGMDYKCAGACTIPPGKYKYVSASGSVRIVGDVNAERFSAAGSIYAQGSIKADTLNFGGSVKINGDVVGENVSGGGIFHAKTIRGGKIRLGGAIVFDDIIGNITRISGSIKGKSIKSEELYMKNDGKSSLEKINAKKVDIKSKRGILRKFSGTIKVGEIAGENIYLESVTADSVAGEDVEIGDNCKIKIVKGGKIKISDKSTVGEVIKK